jgi:glyoxylase-like metal-dependent hydrolase (beta-lactamase superfamily II)
VTTDQDRHAWERPGAHRVADGVHRIPLPLPGDALRAVNTYAITDGDGLIMVDGGWAMADSVQLLERSLDEAGHRLGDIGEFLVTHVHRDHYTQAVAVRRITGAAVALGAGERPALDEIHGSDRFRNDIIRLRRAGALELVEVARGWGRIDFDLDDWAYPDRWLDDGVDLPLKERTLRVIATPGHTVGHVVFHDANAGIMFAGDHVLPHITPSVGVQVVRPESPLRDYLHSLRLILALPDARLLPAHGPVTESTHQRVEELLHHHDERLTATANAVVSGHETAFAVAGVLGWTRRQRRLAELDTFNQVLAVNETMAHLDVLVERAWLTRTNVDGVAHYAPR